MSLITCIILGVLSLILFITGICFIIYEDIALSSYSIFLAIILAFGAAYCGHVYFRDLTIRVLSELSISVSFI